MPISTHRGTRARESLSRIALLVLLDVSCGGRTDSDEPRRDAGAGGTGIETPACAVGGAAGFQTLVNRSGIRGTINICFNDVSLRAAASGGVLNAGVAAGGRD